MEFKPFVTCLPVLGGQSGNFKNLRSTPVLGQNVTGTKRRPQMMLERSYLKEKSFLQSKGDIKATPQPTCLSFIFCVVAHTLCQLLGG